MSLHEIMFPIFKWVGIIVSYLLVYAWGNWNGYVEATRFKAMLANGKEKEEGR